ncbi:MBL fold metallo-hydrolase [Calditerricola satsumensis]|uniref:MBL fold metallo-hydrolase n=2 Tax=Calditerricola satsumensis TaxID=373054 RepID=A0A8J3BDT6_9BACI|nr:MBL fold metallo-hydrolase [Calditerricola satsumensis]
MSGKPDVQAQTAVRKLAEGLWLVRLPLPFPLRWVNSYVWEGRDGLTVVDPGLHDDPTKTAWREAFRTLGRDVRDVRRIVLTHYHPDHYGMAGWMQQASGAPVYLTVEGRDVARRFWDPAYKQGAALADFFRTHGMTETWAAQMAPHLDQLREWVEPHPVVTPMAEGNAIPLGDRNFRVLVTPGHADGHVCLYDPEDGMLVAGDLVLPRITPNVSLWPGCDPNPLQSFLASLERVARLHVREVLPGHGEPFADLGGRVAALRAHHDKRLEAMERHIGPDGTTAFDVCVKVFGEALSVHDMRFAMAETLAHLVYLEEQGRLRRERRGDVWVFVRA